MNEQGRSNDELAGMLLEARWRLCAPDWDTSTPEQLLAGFEHFCETYVWIRFPGKGKIRFHLREAQKDTALLWLTERHTLALKARQIGFSTLISIFCLWATFFYGDRIILMISRTERDAKKLLKHAKYALKYLPEWLKFRGPHPTITDTKISFTNESEIESLPSASDPARGDTGWATVVDEMGQLPNSEEAWASIEPTADAGGRVIMLGTAKGEGNLFHKLWVGSHGYWKDRDGTVREEGAGTNRFTNIFHGWWADGRRDDAWYEQQERELPEWQLAQEYPSNPTEAFLKSGRPIFDAQMLAELPRTAHLRGFLDYDGRFIEDRMGSLRMWELPETGTKYTMGVDVAEGLDHGDFSSIHIINSKTGYVDAHWHGHIDPDLLATDIIIPLGIWYNNALVLVESNNHGLTTLTALKNEQYFPLYRERRHGHRQSKATDALGWRTTQKTKPLAIDELNKAIRGGSCIPQDENTISELRMYQRDEKGKMAGVPHDDRVMSLAIANQGLKYVHNRQYKTTQDKIQPGTMAWWVRAAENSHGKRKVGKAPSDTIGSTAVA